MALRINTNIEAIRALRNLRSAERSQAVSLERLSTGLRINRASDDPSGLVISEQLRAQIQALKQASENTQNATNLVGTADGALQQIHNLLNQIRGSVLVALNGASPDQVAAEQAAVNEAISAIDRVAQTTRFGNRELLNGNSGYTVTATNANISNLELSKFIFAPGSTSRTVSVAYTTLAERATLTGIGAAGAAGATLRITGALGSREVTVAALATAAQVGAAINTVAQETGVFADGLGAAFTDDFGSNQFMNIEVLSGAVAGLGATTTDTGVDGVASINGATFTGRGLHFSILLNDAQFEFDFLAATTTAGGPYTFSVARSGISFQVNETANPDDRISLGIRDISATRLGYATRLDELANAATGSSVNEGGFLSSLVTGAGNDLTANPVNALRILDAAQASVSRLRGFLGGIQKFNLEPNLANLEVTIENITAAESAIRDLDFAEESAQLARAQILYQSGIAVLGSANLAAQNVLALIQ
ncbi:MAG: flagellin [Candidatus Brocadiae bacterium]|nr:flagellin [Candidatus Brocadiia bacterium]